MRSEDLIAPQPDHSKDEQIFLRPAAVVMAPARAKAACANALSFSRSFIRKMLRERWHIERERVAVDSEGRGEGLYRIIAGDRTFHFLAISNVFPADQKIDRSFGINWDVSAAICQGPWTPEREALLRQEIPKQYSGRYDSDTICFCRGNRSERLFDHVVDSLTAGEQPDAELLATVGYILRSTAFAGNGLFGIKPFEGLGLTHPLGLPYHAQILAAYMLREFVFDLVDAMAAARAPVAAKLDRRLKRYLGVGNSAGLGLVPFVANHPQIVQQWCLTNERALASAKQRIATPGGPAANKFLGLLQKAERYFRQDPRDGNGIFASYEKVASEIEIVRERAAKLLDGSAAAKAQPWGQCLDWIEQQLHPETVEVIWSLLLELYPDLIDKFETQFFAVESADIDPTMTVGELQRLTRVAYEWLLPAATCAAGDMAYFWYYPVEAPDEPRRGRRDIAPQFEFESKMDLPLKIGELLAALARHPGEKLVASVLAESPGLRAIIVRVQSNAALPYAELRENFLSSSFTPFSVCRFVLAFYGMEKYDPRPPRSTKGALLQGAPIADEIAAGIDGEWPFPLIPDLGGRKKLHAVSEFVPQRVVESSEISVKKVQELAKTKEVRSRTHSTATFPLEYRRLLTKALLSGGYGLGTAEFVARAAELGEALGESPLAALLDQITVLPKQPEIAVGAERATIDAAQTPAFGLAATMLDLAQAAAKSSTTHRGLVCLRNAKPSPLFLTAAYLAKRDLTVLIFDRLAGAFYASGGGASAGGWLLKASGCTVDTLRALSGLAQIEADSPDFEKIKFSDASVLCLAQSFPMITPTTLTEAARGTPTATTRLWQSDAISRRQKEVDQNGFTIPQDLFERLLALAKRTLVPETVEQKIVMPG